MTKEKRSPRPLHYLSRRKPVILFENKREKNDLNLVPQLENTVSETFTGNHRLEVKKRLKVCMKQVRREEQECETPKQVITDVS